jgi:hypothetical protein
MIRDEDLAVYLDGEADPERTRAIEAALTADPDLRARLDRLQRSDADVKAAFDGLLDSPVPDRLVQAVRAASTARTAPHVVAEQTAEVIPLRPRRREAGRWAWPASIAAALIGGVLVGSLVGPGLGERGADWRAAGPGAPQARAALAAGLSRSPSGVAFNLAGGRKATPVLTFASRSGDLCRQFDIAGAGAGAAERGLACRSSGAAWRLVALTSGGHAPAGDYRTAAGPGSDPVSAMADRLIRGEPMDAAQEAAALGASAARSGTPAR